MFYLCKKKKDKCNNKNYLCRKLFNAELNFLSCASDKMKNKPMVVEMKKRKLRLNVSSCLMNQMIMLTRTTTHYMIETSY
jgi:hypothetical protein